DVEFAPLALEISGITYLQASANAGVPLATLEQAIVEELERFRREGPTAEELERVRTQHRAAFLRGIEKVGGFVGKAGILAESAVYGGSPDAWKEALADMESATVEDLRDVVDRWVTDAPFILEVTPVPERRAVASTADRGSPPLPESQPEVEFPDFDRSTLSNGLELLVVERPGLPLVNLRLLLD